MNEQSAGGPPEDPETVGGVCLQISLALLLVWFHFIRLLTDAQPAVLLINVGWMFFLLKFQNTFDKETPL